MSAWQAWWLRTSFGRVSWVSCPVSVTPSHVQRPPQKTTLDSALALPDPHSRANPTGWLSAAQP